MQYFNYESITNINQTIFIRILSLPFIKYGYFSLFILNYSFIN